jgi:SOS-response transcriptional repressor LexA
VVKERILTACQKAVLNYMVDQVRREGRPPTMREICIHFGWGSTNGAYQHLCALRNKGLLVHTPRTTRGWMPTSAVGAWLRAYSPEHNTVGQRLQEVWAELTAQDLATLGALASCVSLRPPSAKGWQP